MAGEKFLYVNSDGFYEEDLPSIQTSAGIADADKLVKTNSQGKIDGSLIDFSLVKRYYVADVASTANIDLATGGLLTIDGVTLVAGERVLVKDQTLPEENGIYEAAAGSWSRVSDYDEAAEIEDGTAVAVGRGTLSADTVFLQTNVVNTVGTDPISFQNIGNTAVSAGDGLTKSGNELSADLLANGGLKFVGTSPDGELAVEPADFAGAGLADDGSDNLAIDFFAPGVDTPAAVDKAVDVSDLAASGTDQGANLIGADPANITNSSSTTVQGVLEDLSDAIDNVKGVEYTVGVGGVNIGEPVFISANDTVTTYGTLANAERVIGLAASSEAASGSVFVLKNDEIIPGILSGATAGETIYWDGSSFVNSIPATSGAHIYKVGVAKNATDLHAEVEFIKRNCP